MAELYAASFGRPGIDPEVAVRLMLAGNLLGIVQDANLGRKRRRDDQIDTTQCLQARTIGARDQLGTNFAITAPTLRPLFGGAHRFNHLLKSELMSRVVEVLLFSRQSRVERR